MRTIKDENSRNQNQFTKQIILRISYKDAMRIKQYRETYESPSDSEAMRELMRKGFEVSVKPKDGEG